jgi:RNA polymerase sigma factor (sigma-70 family)
VIVADNGLLAADQETDQGTEGEHRTPRDRLIRDALDGRLEALDELVPELTPMLWHVARATGLSRPDAEDVVQTAWLNLVSHLGTIHTPAALTSWLVTTTKREAWRVRAAERKTLPANQEWLAEIADPGAGAEEHIIVKDEQQQLLAAFATLPGRCQELLRFVACVPRPNYDEVARVLGVPRGAVGPTRARCLGKLRSALSGEGDRE